MRIRVQWVILAVTFALVVWATLPPDREVALGKTCQPATLRARVSRMIYGDVFWRAQLRAVNAERDRLLMSMAHPEEDEAGPAIENRMMHLNEGAAATDPEALQRQADATQQRRQDRVTYLVGCQIQIQQRLGP